MKAWPRRSEPAGARAHAFEILLRVERSRAFASILLEKREAQLADRRDAGLLHEIVLGVLRRRSVLDHVLDAVAHRESRRMDPEVRVALRIGAYGLLYLDRVPGFAAVDSAVELVKAAGRVSASGFANAALRSIVRRGRALLPGSPRRGDLAALSLFHSHPRWWVERVVERLGWDGAVELLEWNNRPAATVLRPNPRRATPTVLARELERDGVSTEACRFVPGALRVRSGRVAGANSLRRGLALVQDEAAQMIPSMFARPVGPRVVELCAAPGGKTLQLAELAPPDALLVAVDRHAGRMRRLTANARRLGEDRLLLVVGDMESGAGPLAARFDRVLLDAPCSGTGTLRRHPEIRWRLERRDLKLFAARQRRLLGAAAALTASKGQLVYSVCSLEPEEGESVVLRFLESHPEFRLTDPRPSLPPECGPLVGPDRFLRTSPARGGLDGFFAALMVRA